MDTRLIKHYEQELAFMRDMGSEFATAYPKIAGRLGMDGLEVQDPYVERLLEGFAFLSARVQLELDLQYPNFTQNLLEIIYPHYLAPTPSMMVAHLQPDMSKADLAEGYVLPRHSELRSDVGDGAHKPCVFRTGHDLTLWPVEVTEAEYIASRGELVALGLTGAAEARAAIRLRLHRGGGGPISELSLDALTVYLSGEHAGNWHLHEYLCSRTCGVAYRGSDRLRRLDEATIAPRGYASEDALLPTPHQSMDGYRLLQEYFAMPERFHFVDIQGLSPAIEGAEGTDCDIFILLTDPLPNADAYVAPGAFLLNAVPAVNLFPKRCDRVLISNSAAEHRVVADRTAPLDYEIYDISSVTGIRGSNQSDRVFRPFYSQSDFTVAGDAHTAYYTKSRKMRQRSEKERLRGVRTSYLGTDMYLSLVDRAESPYPADVEQLAVEATCTNRDLPLLLLSGGAGVFHLPGGGPVKTITTPIAPTRPKTPLAQGGMAWRLISHLSLNYMSIADSKMGGGAEALRELIGTYAPSGDRTIEKQLEGIVGVKSRPIVRRMSDEILSTAVRGLEIKLEFDDSFFEGTSAYLIGSVLERFFRRQTTINSFTETVLHTHQRGEIARWKAKSGLGRLI